MSRVCARRDIDLPAGDLTTVVESLSELSRRVAADSQLPVDAVLDYTAAIDVYDVLDTGRILVVWTVWFSAPDVRECIAEVLIHAVFRDFVDQLAHQLRWTP
jgi:hypothetical protein